MSVMAVWDRARYLSVTEAPYNTKFYKWIRKKQFCFFQTAETGERTPSQQESQKVSQRGITTNV